MGLKYEYNDVYIEVPVSMLGASHIMIGSAADYDRIKGLLPCQARINDAANSIVDVVTLEQGTNKIQGTSGSSTISLTKSSNELEYKVTT